MPDIYQLEHLLSIAEHGTLSKAAEELHLSQSALSRSMQKLESELQVTLFERRKNKVELNQNGELAVECAKKVIVQMQDMIEKVRTFDRNSRTIAVGSCAPAPLLDAVPALSDAYPEMTILSEMKEQAKLLQGLKDGIYQIIIMGKNNYFSPCLPDMHYPEKKGFISQIWTEKICSSIPK